MRRLVIALALAVGLSVLVAAPSQAALYASGCKVVAQDEIEKNEVCMGVDYHRIAGAPGVEVDRITISYDGGDMQSVDCYSLKIKNDSGVAWWVRQGDGCDIGGYPTYRGYVPNQALPQSAYANVVWYGNANIAGTPDKDFTLTVHCDQ